MSATPDDPETAPPPTGRRLGLTSDLRSLTQTITLIIAVTALALAGWALLRSGSSGDRDYSDTQRAEAKTKVCAAFDVVRRGVKVNTSISMPDGPDAVAGQLAASTSARLAASAGGLYLSSQLDPATPPELADQTREFANLLAGIGANATAGAPDSDPEQAARLKAADAANTKLGELCK